MLMFQYQNRFLQTPKFRLKNLQQDSCQFPYSTVVIKVLIGGAGGPASEGVIRSLLEANSKFDVIGMGSDTSDLVLSSARNKYLVPNANENSYFTEVFKIVRQEKPDFLHAQNDREVLEISKYRDSFAKEGVVTFLPNHNTIETCVDKWRSYSAFENAGIKVPKNIKINEESDLEAAFKDLANSSGYIWLRSNSIGGGGIGALPTNDYLFAKKWIDFHKGWSNFIAAEILQPETVTWLSIWHEGSLVLAQSRKRGGWVHGNRTLSGVTGVTKIGQTLSDPIVDEIAKSAALAVDGRPHGIFGVDMAYDTSGIPNPTEINIARFFTTIYFFTKAGLNMPELFVDLGLNNVFKPEKPIVNPLPVNLSWFRGMDREPKLMHGDQVMQAITKL